MNVHKGGAILYFVFLSFVSLLGSSDSTSNSDGVPLTCAMSGLDPVEAYIATSEGTGRSYIPLAPIETVYRYFLQYTRLRSTRQYYGIVFCFNKDDTDLAFLSWKQEIEREIKSVNVHVFRQEQRKFLDVFEIRCGSRLRLRSGNSSPPVALIYNLTGIKEFDLEAPDRMLVSNFSSDTIREFLVREAGVLYPQMQLKPIDYVDNAWTNSTENDLSPGTYGYKTMLVRDIARYLRKPGSATLLSLYTTRSSSLRVSDKDIIVRNITEVLSRETKTLQEGVQVIHMPVVDLHDAAILQATIGVTHHPAILGIWSASGECLYPNYARPQRYSGSLNLDDIRQWILSPLMKHTGQQAQLPNSSESEIRYEDNKPDRVADAIESLSVMTDAQRLAAGPMARQVICIELYREASAEIDESALLAAVAAEATNAIYQNTKFSYYRINITLSEFLSWTESAQHPRIISDFRSTEFFPAIIVYLSDLMGKPLRYYGRHRSKDLGRFLGRVMTAAVQQNSVWSMLVESSYLREEDQPPAEWVTKRISEAYHKRTLPPEVLTGMDRGRRVP